jgi:hypothetical protein
MVGANRTIRQPAGCHQGKSPGVRDDLNSVWWKHIEQAGTDENLIEHISIIVHLLT